MRIARATLCFVMLAACERGGTHRDLTAPVLVFDGASTSPTDVSAIETLLDRERIAYGAVGSAELDAMSTAELGAHRLLIVPGGDFVAMGDGLAPGTPDRVRAAVQGGLGYLGICGGAFLAGHFPPPYRGLDLASGAQFHFYSAEDRGVHRAAVRITRGDAPSLDAYWEDGPQLGGWGDAVARYPDGTPAIAQGRSGRGWVLLSGIHPEAPASWRDGLAFETDAETSEAYAITLIRAALDARALPTL